MVSGDVSEVVVRERVIGESSYPVAVVNEILVLMFDE